MIKNMSLTNMSHKLIDTLSAAPFDDLFTENQDGSADTYSFDQFRRLYNDAVESMNAYKLLASTLDYELEDSRKHCNELYNTLMEFTDNDH